MGLRPDHHHRSMESLPPLGHFGMDCYGLTPSRARNAIQEGILARRRFRWRTPLLHSQGQSTTNFTDVCIWGCQLTELLHMILKGCRIKRQRWAVRTEGVAICLIAVSGYQNRSRDTLRAYSSPLLLVLLRLSRTVTS